MPAWLKFNSVSFIMVTRTYHDLLDRDDEISSYLLGFWMADGNIHLSWSTKRARRQKEWRIYNTDLQVMSMISSWFGKGLKARAETEQRKVYYSLSVKSDRLFDACYDVTRSTSKSDKPINLPYVRPALRNHFVRGFFDGDGSISVKHYANRHGKEADALQTSFTAGLATGDFLEQLRDMIRSHIPVGLKKINIGKSSQKLTFNQYDSMLLCEWMYDGATVFMERKKALWEMCDRVRLAGSKKFFSNKV